MKLVERERLRVPVKSKEAYTEFFNSSGVNQLFDEAFLEKLAISQIMLLLKEKPLTTGEISDQLGLNPSDVSRYMIVSSRHGLVRYDTNQQCYALVLN
jgi:F420-non-reducing hydrogenase iron-sulfur subunit